MELRVGPERQGERLDALLAGPLGSRSRAQRLIAAGQVLVDGRPAPKRHRAREGELVTVDESDRRERPVPEAAPAALRIVHEDEHLLIVDKPAGVVVHPARGHATGTLVQALAGRAAGGEDPERAGIVHRLDRDTSGLLVVARSEEAHRALRDMLQRREIVREYITLVEGRPPARSGTIDAPLGRDRRERTRMSTDTDDPRSARTHFEILRALPQATLLRVRLETGRTHQIRAHLLAIGHPVVGDPVYGTAGLLGLDRQFLHAARLAFRHPVTGEQLDVRSELPQDLRAALVRAGG
ncbi:MAG: RluA family pseudouridine synthase [Solirubrobacteraceae bacterium]|nr:RluA family pseudouridine synthase [Solirubrobacteraceae bacterium]